MGGEWETPGDKERENMDDPPRVASRGEGGPGSLQGERETQHSSPDHCHEELGDAQEDHRQRGNLDRSSPKLPGGGSDARTEMWLEQHSEQMRGGQFPPGFVRSPLVPSGMPGRGAMGKQSKSSGLNFQQLRVHPSTHGNHHPSNLRHPHHPRSGSFGGNSYTQTRQSSPSQWSLSQFSQSQCVTPRSGVGGSVGGSVGVHGNDGGSGQHNNTYKKTVPRHATPGISLARSHHGGERLYSQSSGTVGTVTPPALQITSPVTPRDYSSGYNSPRVSEDLQRYTSEEFPCGRQARRGERRSVDGLSRGLSEELSGGLSPHAGAGGSGTPKHDNGRSSFKSLVSYLDTMHNSVSERSGGLRTPRSCSSFDVEEEDTGDWLGARDGVLRGGRDIACDPDVDLLASQMKDKVNIFPGSFQDSLLLNSQLPEQTPFLDKAQIPPHAEGEAQKARSDDGSPSIQSEGQAAHTNSRKHQQQADVFSFPVDTLSSKTRGVLGSGATGSWPNFQTSQGPCVEETYTDDPHLDVGRDQLDEIGHSNVCGTHMVGADGDSTSGCQSEGDDPPSTSPGPASHLKPPHQFVVDVQEEEDYLGQAGGEVEFEEMTLRIIHRKNTTGFEFERELPLNVGDEIAGRFRIVELLGQAAFCRAVQAIDLHTGQHVCLKVVKNSKDYFDQSLDEVRLLHYVNQSDPSDEQGIVRLYDFFYYAEHLILVMELLRANLYEFSMHDRSYFTPARLKRVASQLLSSVAFMHSLSLIHADLKPENILMKSFAACQIKLIDLGSSFYNHDRRASYVVQSRSYRAPEVILGCHYDNKIDIWSIGCILVELAIGEVLFNDCSGAQMLARMESVLGSTPAWMRDSGRFAKRYYLGDGRLFEQSPDAGLGMGRAVDVLHPQPSSLNYVLDDFDKDMADFISLLLELDPNERISAKDALQHPYLLE